MDVTREANYIQFPGDVRKKRDKLEELLDDYLSTVELGENKGLCPLLFWKVNECRFKSLADLAKKVGRLGACSALVGKFFLLKEAK